MNIYCIVPTWKEYPTEAIKSIQMQKQQPTGVVVGVDESDYSVSNGMISYILDAHKERLFSALNIVRMMDIVKANFKIKDDDIIVLIDGDDRLFDEWALVEIFKAHRSGAWVTYGSYVTKSELEAKNGRVKYCKLHRDGYRGNENYRKLPWRASHLKTFRYGLYRRLKQDWFKGPDGEPLRVCSDLALMFPILEMAGKEHVRHIHLPLYIYNDMSEFNDHKVRGEEQKNVEMWLRMQEPYKKVAKL